MNTRSGWNTMRAVALGALLLAVGAGGGVWWANTGMASANHPAQEQAASATPAEKERTVLYWYDPMYPQNRFDKPGKSPYMDMDLVPRYADDSEDATAVRIDPAVTQNLGMRVAPVKRSVFDARVEATGVLGFNERDVAIVQTRTGGFVEGVAALAPGDLIAAGARIAELLVPEWAAVQQEYLALRAAGDAQLAAAARERMLLAGMPTGLIREIESSGRARSRVVGSLQKTEFKVR